MWTRRGIDGKLASEDMMPSSALPRELRESRFFSGLLETHVERIASASRLVEFSGGTTIFREGCENRNLYLIHDGQVTLEMNVPIRGRVPILSLGPGDVLAWSAVLGDACSMTATAIAVEPTKVLEIPGEILRALCDADHDLGYRFFRQLASALSLRLVATRLQLLDLFSETTPR